MRLPGLQLRRAGPRVLQQARDDPIEALDLIENHLHETLAVVAFIESFDQHLRARADAGKRVADLVCHARRQLAEGGEALVAPQLLLHPVLLRQVVERNEQPGRIAQPVAVEQDRNVAAVGTEQPGLALGVRHVERITDEVVAGHHGSQEFGRGSATGRRRANGEQSRPRGIDGVDASIGVQQEYARVGIRHQRADHALERELGCLRVVSPGRATLLRHAFSAFHRTRSMTESRREANAESRATVEPLWAGYSIVVRREGRS